MRQLLTLRFFAALAALALLAVGVDNVFASGGQQGTLAVTGPSNLDEDGNVVKRRIDVISSVARIERSEDFVVGTDGRTVGVLDAVLDADGQRVMRIAPGTPGEISCANLVAPDRCVVLADVLGDAVVWFALLPKAPRETAELPPIVDLQDGYAIFENGWEISYPPVIERDTDGNDATCAGEDIPSFSDFLRRFGPDSTTIVDLATQQVVEVQCGEEFVAPASSNPYEGDLDATFIPGVTTTIVAINPDVEAPDS